MDASETKKFLDHKLLVEVKGPELQPLTLIDLPGLIRGTDKDDNDFVQNLAISYMKQERTVILAVVHARSDIDTQGVLNLIKDMDPAGERTIGVITKPDKLTDEDDKAEISRLARNEKYTLQRGWHVVRNRGSSKDRSQSDQLKAEAAVFQQQPWDELRSTQLGIETLRTRLSKVLLDETCKGLNPVIEEVELQIADCNAELERLGSAKTSPGQQRSFLSNICENFRDRVRNGVEGNYTNPYYEEHLDQRLRATVRRLNDQFDQDMQIHGHRYHIQDVMENPRNESTEDRSAPETISAISFLEYIDLEVLQTGRAQELPGRYNPDLVATVFRKQSTKWKDIARNHARSIFDQTVWFLLQILKSTTEGEITSRIWTGLIQPRLRMRQKALEEKVEELLKPFTDFLPFSTPQRYAKGLARFSEQRSRLEASCFGQNSVRDFVACTDVLFAMLAYYDNAMETFIDNMITLAVENCLLYDLSNLIPQHVIATMTDEDLKRYTEEPEDFYLRRCDASIKQQRLIEPLETFKESVLSATSTLNTPPSFSSSLTPGNTLVGESMARMDNIQLRMQKTPPRSNHLTLNNGQADFSEDADHDLSTHQSPQPLPRSLSPKSSASQPSSYQGASGRLTPDIMYPSPAPSSASPNTRDWRKRSPRRSSSRIHQPEPVQAESASNAGS